MRHDLLLHFFCGYWIMLFCIFAGTRKGITFMAVLVIAVGKEFIDSLGYGTPDLSDIIFTILPCLILIGRK